MMQSHIPNGDFAAALEKRVEVDPTEHGLGPLHRLASRVHPPAEETRQIMAKAPRSTWQRASIAVGVFLLGQLLGLLYVGAVKPARADTVFSVITALTWAGPVVAWFAFRRRKLGLRQIKGHPLNTLAVLSAGMPEPWIEVRVSDEDVMIFELGEEGKGKPPLELAAEEDLVVSFDSVYVRAKTGVTPQADASEPSSQASEAVECLHRALMAELSRSPDQLWELESVCSEDIDEALGGHLDKVSFVVKQGQRYSTDGLCEAVERAVNTLRNQYELTLGD